MLNYSINYMSKNIVEIISIIFIIFIGIIIIAVVFGTAVQFVPHDSTFYGIIKWIADTTSAFLDIIKSIL
jgi:hypothetical protein